MRRVDSRTLINISSFAAFLIPATSLWLNSGYAYGTALFLFAALCFFHRWCGYRQSKQTIVIAFLFLAMAVLWYELSSYEQGAKEWERTVKYVASAICLLYAMAFPPKRQAFYLGLMIGCIGGGLMGLWQVYGVGLERANGFSNAIQWGNIALLMATMVLIQLSICWKEASWVYRICAIVSIVLGVEASILSASRGGWLALLAVAPVMVFFIFRYRRDTFNKFFLITLAAALLFTMMNSSMLTTRWQKANIEVTQYFGGSKVNTSLGIRLEQYRSAIEMIKEKPLFGWGTVGYLDEMRKRADSGRYDPSIAEYNFIHHEILDLWVKTGLMGLFTQMFVYVYVFSVFWPTQRRMRALEGNLALWKNEFALRLCGITVVLMYFVFNQSVQFFVQNNGIIFFVFPILILWSMLNDQTNRQPTVLN